MRGPHAFEQIQTTKIFARNGRHSSRQSIAPIFLAILNEQMICLPANLPNVCMDKRSHHPRPLTIILSKRIGKWHRRQLRNYPQLICDICASSMLISQLFETHNLQPKPLRNWEKREHIRNLNAVSDGNYFGFQAQNYGFGQICFKHIGQFSYVIILNILTWPKRITLIQTIDLGLIFCLCFSTIWQLFLKQIVQKKLKLAYIRGHLQTECSRKHCIQLTNY